MPGENKRPAVQARKVNQQSAKGARRRNRTGDGPRRTDTARASYGNRPGLSITVQIPPLQRPVKPSISSIKLWLRRIARPKVLVPLGLLLVVLNVASWHGGNSSPATNTVVAAERTEPDFRPLKPSDEKSSPIKYDGKRNLVTYTTNFSGSRITVSQQALPKSFTTDSKALAKAADSINAEQRIDTDKGPVHVASNDKGNDQMALFASSEVLVFIHTDRTMEDASWKSFIELLEIKS